MSIKNVFKWCVKIRDDRGNTDDTEKMIHVMTIIDSSNWRKYWKRGRNSLKWSLFVDLLPCESGCSKDIKGKLENNSNNSQGDFQKSIQKKKVALAADSKYYNAVKWITKENI